MEHPFVHIPEGWFVMGSDDGPEDERPAHRVWVDAFELAVYPVTCAEYAAFMQATGHEPPREWTQFATAPDLPVVGVSWLDCQAYCAWRAAAGKPLRLPTEAEWEYAARAGVAGRKYPTGDDIPGWIPAGGRGPLAGPWPVTLGEPNAFGLYGIAANVHEWCADWYSAGYYAASPARNPTGPDRGERRASRGGSWRHAITISRCSARSRIDPSFRYTDYGFRVARAEAREAHAREGKEHPWLRTTSGRTTSWTRRSSGSTRQSCWRSCPSMAARCWRRIRPVCSSKDRCGR